jgi:hypothetical protein
LTANASIAGNKGEQATAKPGERTTAGREHAGQLLRKLQRPTRDVDRSDTVRSDRKKTCTPRTADDTAPIIVPDGAGIWTFGDHLRHLAGHRGTIPLERDEFGRCVICVRRGFFTTNA